MHLRVKRFQLAAAGNSQEECEDAYAYGDRQKRVAISDGASRGTFEARLWARALVEAFVHEPPVSEDPADLLRWLESPIREWRRAIPWEQLPDNAAKKALQGAAATLLGLRFVWPASAPRLKGDVPLVFWRAVAVGDSCLLQVRDDTVLIRFPIKRAADFGMRPPLLRTNADDSRRILQDHLQIHQDIYRPGDVLVLATDTLAKWFYRQEEAGQRPWRGFIGLTWKRFRELVERIRQNEEVDNDDMTLMLIWMEECTKKQALRGATNEAPAAGG